MLPFSTTKIFNLQIRGSRVVHSERDVIHGATRTVFSVQRMSHQSLRMSLLRARRSAAAPIAASTRSRGELRRSAAVRIQKIVRGQQGRRDRLASSMHLTDAAKASAHTVGAGAALIGRGALKGIAQLEAVVDSLDDAVGSKLAHKTAEMVLGLLRDKRLRTCRP